MSETVRPRHLPGDPAPAELVRRMIRVDHAGEVGATHIYEGQLAILGNSASGEILRHMQAQERRHREIFERMIVERRIRPTILSPIWHAAGFALGAATALLGEKAAMACTVAVEEVIDEHYREQIAALGDSEPELRAMVEEFRTEEVEHRDIGLERGAADAPFQTVLNAAVRAGSRLAIVLSSRL
jgi:ubiquinone biosynthesis monooxygenase Coq7